MTVSSILKRLDYIVTLYDPASSYALQAVYNNFYSMYYRKVLNGPGLLTVVVPDDHDIVQYLQDDLLVKVALVAGYPYPLGSIIDFYGIYRNYQIATDQYGDRHYVLQFPGATEILSRPIIGYKAGTANYSTWSAVAADTIMRNIIGRNSYTPEIGGARSRSRTGELDSYWAYDGATGAKNTAGTATALTYSAAWRNALEALQELAQLGDVDFDVRYNHVHYNYQSGTIDYLYTDGGLAAFTYNNLLGVDRTTSVYFDLALHNVAEANLNADRLRERTVAIVGGQGEGSARTIATRTGANFNASHNDYELFVDARSNASGELNSIGDAKLLEAQARTIVEANVEQSDGYQYLRDYDLGDRVSVRFGGTTQTKRITAVEVSFTEQDDNAVIRVEFQDP
mgnify:FL=1